MVVENFREVWKEGLSPDQIIAAGHIGTHALLLSGPGTGKTKTITHRALALTIAHEVPSETILILTFTRVAAYQLKKEIHKVLEPLEKGYPRISTLHSFALRQLLINSARIDSLPKPLRIADDWEERKIIYENLKNDLSEHLKTILPGISHAIDKIEALFNQLSSDWETLRIELEENQHICRDGHFIGAWKEHREMFGYTMRSELIYQLKRALQISPDFALESQFKEILVDEYQDLNACDLTVIEELSKRGGKLYASGDDDQSIYGFRYADPLGIRIFKDKYGAQKYDLEVCFRCDKSILDIGEFVANLDYQRLPKKTKPREKADMGEVHLLCFENQYNEANWIAQKCKDILKDNPQNSILILMRSDFRGVMSKVIKDALVRDDVPVAIKTEETPLDNEDGRVVVSFLRLMVDPKDHLAWYSLLLLERGIGEKTLNQVRQIAKTRGCRFYDALEEVINNSTLTSS